jgi:hypothetical protein
MCVLPVEDLVALARSPIMHSLTTEECRHHLRQSFDLAQAIGNIDRTIYRGAYPDGTAIRFESFMLWES